MTTVIEPKTFEEYRAKVKELNAKSDKQQLLALIDDYARQHQDVAELDAFFKGEHAFYSGNYEKALVQYMQARQVEGFEFFCYRATAFVSFMRGNLEKSASFIEKALQANPDDLSTLNLKHDLLVKQEEFDQAGAVKSQVDAHVPAEYESTQAEPAPSPEHKSVEPPSDFIASKLGVDVDAEQELEQRMLSYRSTIQNNIQNYLSEKSRITSSRNDTLWVLGGWDSINSRDVIPRMPAKNGGYFIRWNGHGIVINPGKSFLERFHAQGLHLQMIDTVIVTEPNPESYADIENIYELNYRLNKVSSELHIIRYYLNHKTHQQLAHLLKPNFKQERNTVHSLELFLDSPDVEKEQITEEIALNYFSTGSRSSFAGSDKTHSLAVRLDLAKGKEVKTVGFVTGAGWTPTLSSHFGKIDIMLSGFGSTQPNDYGKLNYNENDLGYFGTYTLLEEIKPALHLVTAFDGKQGDIRLEVMKKLRKEFAKSRQGAANLSIALPADHGMIIDMKTLRIKSSVNEEMLDPGHVQVCKTQDAFGTLHYVSQNSFL